jgi:hypothetical protein
LQRLRVLPQVDAVRLLEVVREVIHQTPVEVVAAQVTVAGGGAHLHHAVADVEDAHVEGATAQVEDEDGLVLLLVHAVREGGRRRLVDDPQHLQSRDASGVLGGGALSVIEVGGHRDDRLRDPLPELLGGVVGEFAQHLCADLLRRIELVTHLEAGRPAVALDDVVRHRPGLVGDLVEVPADEPLGRVDGALGVEDRLAPGQLAHQAFPGVGEGHHGRCRAVALAVGHDGRLAALPHGDHRVGGAQVDAHCLGHEELLPVRRLRRLSGPRSFR